MKKMQFLKVSMIAATVFMAACSTVSADKPAKAAAPAKMAKSSAQIAFDKALAATIAAADKAASVGGEWRDIRWKKSKINYIAKAKKAAKSGDFKKAMSLLETAKFQAEMGYQQALDQKNAGPAF